MQTIIPFQDTSLDGIRGIRLTTARYYTPSGVSIQGKGIEPDIKIEQGTFESYNYKTYSESDLKDSLDNEIDKEENQEIDEEETNRLQRDYQLTRAIDLIHGINIYHEGLENK